MVELRKEKEDVEVFASIKSTEFGVGQHELSGNSGGEVVGLKSKFGRMEIKSKLSTVISRHGERAAVLHSSNEANIYDNDDTLVNLGGFRILMMLDWLG